jgi:hypothetical protein
MAEWKTLFAGDKNGRMVRLEQYYEGNSLRVTTTPKGNAESASASSAQTAPDGADATLEIHAADAAHLARRLVEEGGFSEEVAREIAQLGHAGSASVPAPEKP